MVSKNEGNFTESVIHAEPAAFLIGAKNIHFNLDLQRFCLIGKISDTDLNSIIDDYERFTLRESLEEQLSFDDIRMPLLLEPYPDGKAFRRVLRLSVEQHLPVEMRSLKATEIYEQLRRFSQSEISALLRSLTPTNYAQARKTIHKRYAQSLFDFDPKALLEELRGKGLVNSPESFLEWMCTLRHHSNARYSESRVFDFLLVANRHKKLLFPFALYRNSLEQRRLRWGRRDSKIQFAALASQHFLAKSKLDLLLSLQRKYQQGWMSHFEHVTRCFALILLASDADTIEELHPAALRKIRLAYESSDGFAAKKPVTRKDTSIMLARAYEVFAKEITKSRRETGAAERPQDDPSSVWNTLTKDFLTSNQASELAKLAGSFFWLEKQCPEYGEWARYFRDFVKVKMVGRKSSLVGHINVFCDFLTETKPPIYSPSALERRHIAKRADTNIPVTYKEFLDAKYDHRSLIPSRALHTLQDFFDWYISDLDTAKQHPVLQWDIPSQPEYKGKTEKAALPVRILKLMKTIVIENDSEWAKSIEEDYIQAFNPGSGQVERVWCPVRASAMITLLTVPLRSIQVRLLDSGQGDELIYDSQSHEFCRNPDGQKDRHFGVLREIFDSTTQTRFTGLFINTNKTQRLYSKGKKGGYEILWENKELNSVLVSLRDWQCRYNPCHDPVHVNELTDRNLHCTESIAPFIPRYFFLFRDPCTKGENEPISYVRLESMFLLLMAETEKRLRAEGEPVTLIKDWEQLATKRIPKSAVTTLHGLRVSGITAFAEAGVPLQILTDFLAGHATILMNLYYQRFGIAKVTQIIDKAAAVMENEAGMESYLDFLADHAEHFLAQSRNTTDGVTSPLSNILPASDDALESLASNCRGFWHIDIDGLCPNGRTLCHNGGPLIGTKGGTRGTPVSGGHGNCPQCRYWVTGPMFLFGQLVKANVLLYHLSEKAEHLVRLEDQLAQLQEAAETGTNNRRRIQEIRSSIEIINQEVENLLATWVKRYEYVVTSAALLNRDSGSEPADPHALVTMDRQSFDVALREGHEFELLDFVNNACEIFQGIDAPSAKLKKAKLLDMLLDRNNMEAFLFKLSEEQALKVGNKMTKFLYDNLDQQAVHDLIDGKRTLHELGIDHSFAERLNTAKPVDSLSLSPIDQKKEDATNE